MPKLLGLKDWILLSSAVVGDVFENVRLVGGLLPNLYEVRYGFVPPNFKQHSYSASVSRLLKTGDLNKVIDNKGKVYLELTSLAKSNLKRRFPLFSKGNWDGNFMIVIFDVPEENRGARDALRGKIRDLGFGMLQESVWVSPYHFEDDLKEFLDEKGYTELVYVFSANKLLGKNVKFEATKIWRLDEVNKMYIAIIESAKALISFRVEKEDLVKLWNQYFQTISKDPLLPKELLPKDWMQKNAFNALLNLHKLTRN